MYIQDESGEDVDGICIDSLTRVKSWLLPTPWNTFLTRRATMSRLIEGYGFGKGFQHVYDTFLPLLADLDRHVRAGRSVVLICHECSPMCLTRRATISSVKTAAAVAIQRQGQHPPPGQRMVRSVVHRLRRGREQRRQGHGSGHKNHLPVEMPTHWPRAARWPSPSFTERKF